MRAQLAQDSRRATSARIAFGVGLQVFYAFFACAHLLILFFFDDRFQETVRGADGSIIDRYVVPQRGTVVDFSHPFSVAALLPPSLFDLHARSRLWLVGPCTSCPRYSNTYTNSATGSVIDRYIVPQRGTVPAALPFRCFVEPLKLRVL